MLVLSFMLIGDRLPPLIHRCECSAPTMSLARACLAYAGPRIQCIHLGYRPIPNR